MKPKVNEVTDYIAQRQVMGNVRSVRQLTQWTKGSVGDLMQHLNRLESRGELKYVLLDKIPGDRYVFLTEALGYDTHKLLLPPIDDETEDKDWAKQIYPLVMIHYRNQFDSQEAKDWRDTCLPTYRSAWFNGPLAAKAKEEGIGDFLSYTGIQESVGNRIERARQVYNAVFGPDAPDFDEEWETHAFEAGETIAEGIHKGIEPGATPMSVEQLRKTKGPVVFLVTSATIPEYLPCKQIDGFKD